MHCVDDLKFTFLIFVTVNFFISAVFPTCVPPHMQATPPTLTSLSSKINNL